MCDGGVTIREALTNFFRAYMRANEIIAHNIEFDKKMIQSEVIRSPDPRFDMNIFMFNDMFNKVRNKKYTAPCNRVNLSQILPLPINMASLKNLQSYLSYMKNYLGRF